MSDNSGWHPDPSDPHTTRYWDGSRWSAELRWDGTAWLDPRQGAGTTPPRPGDHRPVTPAPVLGSAPVAMPALPTAGPSPVAAPAVPGGFAMSRTSWVLFGGAAVAGIGAMLPWADVSTSYGYTASAAPGDIGSAAFLLLGLVALAVWLGWPTRERPISSGRLIGLVAVVALMTFFALSNFNAIADYNEGLSASAESSVFGGVDDYTATASAGLGLWLWLAGSIAIWVGAFRAWRARRSTT
jgi:hypothetical protein